MKLRNVSGYPLDIPKYGRRVGPGEVIDTSDLGHDPEADGVITGFAPVEDEPKQQASKPKTPAKADDKDSKEQK